MTTTNETGSQYVNNSKDLHGYKQNIMAMILGNQLITEAIDPNMEPGEMPYQNIFPYCCISHTVTDTRNYILIEASMPEPFHNSRYSEINLIVTVVCHDEMMRTDYGMTRPDYIGAEIEKMLDGNTQIGLGEAEIIANVEGAWSERHCYRKLTFKVKRIKSRC